MARNGIIMYLFIDTEFTDFINSDLISLGLVSEDGTKEFYVEITDFNRNYSSPFVRSAVYPLLDNAKYGMSFKQAAEALEKWIANVGSYDITIVWDFNMDLYFFRELYNPTKPDPLLNVKDKIYSKAFANRLYELGFHMQQAHHIGQATLVHAMENYFERIDNRRHHALVDAKANRHGWLKAIEAAKTV
jgi:hypothetical protein